MNVCVFCSSNDVGKKYTDAARECAELIARHGHTLVWGGSDTGTMKVIADAAQAAGGKIIGISMELLRDKARPNADLMLVLPSLHERKVEMLRRADAIIVLPGGIGTLDEITETLELKKHLEHDKPVVFLNTDDFYAGLNVQLQRMEREGFLNHPLSDFLVFVQTPEEAMRYIEAHAN